MDDILTCIHLTIFFGEEKFFNGWWKFAFSEAHKFSRQIVFSGQPAEFFFSKKNCQMKAGQYTIQLTNPVIRYYNPMPGNLPPFVTGENIFANIEIWSDNRVPWVVINIVPPTFNFTTEFGLMSVFILTGF